MDTSVINYTYTDLRILLRRWWAKHKNSTFQKRPKSMCLRPIPMKLKQMLTIPHRRIRFSHARLINTSKNMFSYRKQWKKHFVEIGNKVFRKSTKIHSFQNALYGGPILSLSKKGASIPNHAADTKGTQEGHKRCTAKSNKKKLFWKSNIIIVHVIFDYH